MFSAGRYTEHEVFVGFLDQQLTAIRASAYGLTEAQARQTPCRSALSVGGILKHVTLIMQLRTEPAGDPDAAPDEAGFARFMASFALTDDETLSETLETFDRVRAAFLAAVRAADPAAEVTEPPAPWDGVHTSTPSVERFALMRSVEEFARHAGHADIIREQLDGAMAASLLMALEGRPGNDFVQPWAPAT